MSGRHGGHDRNDDTRYRGRERCSAGVGRRNRGYTENGAPVALSPAATITDVDDINLVAGVVRIVLGAFDGDLLRVNGLQSGTFSGIDFSYDAALHSLMFTRPTWVADYQPSCRRSSFCRPATIRPIPGLTRRARYRGRSSTAMLGLHPVPRTPS